MPAWWLVCGGFLIGMGLERAAPGGLIPWWVDVAVGSFVFVPAIVRLVKQAY